MSIQWSHQAAISSLAPSARFRMGGIMAEVVMELVNGEEIVAAITRRDVERMDVKPGDPVFDTIKPIEGTVDPQ